jgi:cation diffusion facilitator CzcD-associated flavoprotein CzcO
VAPDGDLFAALRDGKASVVTGSVATLVEGGVRLASGETVDADLVVTATGLELRLLGGMELLVDGTPVALGQALTYRGTMLSDVPNLALATGYTNATWTLKCELTARWVCRLLAYMARHGIARCTPRRPPREMRESPAIELTSGYVQRALGRLPRQGPRPPWRLHQSYFRDAFHLRWSRIDDGVLELVRGDGPMALPASERLAAGLAPPEVPPIA